MTEKLSRYNHFFQMADALRVVYNALSGTVVRLDRDSWNLILNGKYYKLQPEISRMLFRQGMLVPEKTDESARAMGKYRQLRNSPNKLMLTIAPTLDCNFTCPYCYENRLPGIMNRETSEQLISFVKNKMELTQDVSVTWYGGEPLLAAESVLKITGKIQSLCKARKKNVSFFLVSNGYLLTEALASELAAAGISGIQITLDGPPDIHNRRRVLRGGGGTFHRLLESVRIAVDTFETVKIRMNLDQENRKKWKPLVEILETAGLLGKIRFEIAGVDATNKANEGYKHNCLSPLDFSQEWINFAEFMYQKGKTEELRLPHMTVCSKVSKFGYVIGPKGNIYSCWNDVGNPEKTTGHVSRPDEADRNQEWEQFNPLDWPECRNCTLLPACMGRCPDLLEKEGPASACGRWKHCLREAVILHTMSKLKGGKNGKPEKQPEIIGAGTGYAE